MAKEREKDPREVTTPVCRASYANLFKAKAFKNKEPKFSLDCILEKDDDLGPMKKAIRAAMVEEFGEEKNWPKKWKKPFKDGNEKEDQEGYADKIYITPTTSEKYPPKVLKKNKDGTFRQIGPDEFKAGDYVAVSLFAKWYDVDGGKGVTFYLKNVLKVRDGEAFGGGSSDPNDQFDGIEVEDSVDDNTNLDDDNGEDPF